MSSRRGPLTCLLTPQLRIEVLETRSLLNGNSLLGLMQPRLSPPPGHEPGLYAWHNPSALTNTAIIRVVSQPNEAHGTLDDNLDVGSNSTIHPNDDVNSPPNDKVNSFVSLSNETLANSTKPFSTSNHSPNEKETPFSDRPQTPHRPPLPRPAETDPTNPPVVVQDDPTRPPTNNDGPSRPDWESHDPNPPAHHGDGPSFDVPPNQPPAPPPHGNRPFPAWSWTWAQAEAFRLLAASNSGASSAPSSLDRSGPVGETAADDFFASAGNNLAVSDADTASDAEELLVWNDELSEMRLIPGSFTPQQSELLGSVLALDVDALGQGVMRFFDRLDQLGNELLAVPDGMGLYPWLLALVATGASIEFIRRRRKPRLVAEFAATSADSSWSWSLGMNDSSVHT